MFMPDYMESHVSALGLKRVLEDLRDVVLAMAEDSGDRINGDRLLWLLEHDLAVAIQEMDDD